MLEKCNGPPAKRLKGKQGDAKRERKIRSNVAKTRVNNNAHIIIPDPAPYALGSRCRVLGPKSSVAESKPFF